SPTLCVQYSRVSDGLGCGAVMGVQASKGYASGARDFFFKCWSKGREARAAGLRRIGHAPAVGLLNQLEPVQAAAIRQRDIEPRDDAPAAWRLGSY
ncbi:hypothetical protein, partial [Mesorhizobium sp.]|uniref:hypothetical protein n=1 Tax=Mesorhizobium sp. TaxID=1871066 RepID=UPI00258081F7